MRRHHSISGRTICGSARTTVFEMGEKQLAFGPGQNSFTYGELIYAETLREAQESWEQLLGWEQCHSEEMNIVVNTVQEIAMRHKQGFVTPDQVAEVNSLCNYIKTMHLFKDDGTPRYSAEQIAGVDTDVKDLCSGVKYGQDLLNGPCVLSSEDQWHLKGETRLDLLRFRMRSAEAEQDGMRSVFHLAFFLLHAWH
ncbi:hypothetical protein GCK32_001576 [Trichostrongylus colubriformis]|uniref:Uncharacterized protein n=1 Tax=Trichostrongylus colubriformis TaxID=6319 RepID=A0AAN8IN61_TRICO